MTELRVSNPSNSIVQFRVGRVGQTESLFRLNGCVKGQLTCAWTKELEIAESQMQSENFNSERENWEGLRKNPKDYALVKRENIKNILDTDIKKVKT